MKEIEVKIEIEDIGKIQSLLESKGLVFGGIVTQRDVVYVPQNITDLPCPAGTNVLRIRTQGETSILTLKRSDPGNHLSKTEHETEVKNPKELALIIEQLGFKKITDTSKSRTKCKVKKYEICLDNVEDVGDFLEIEELTDRDPLVSQKEMLEYLKSLDVDVSKRVDVGYDVLWFRKFGNKT